jgi:phage FluMu protein Com
MTTLETSTGEPNQELRLYLAFHFGVKCRHCESLVLDPDKSKGHTYLRGKCPSCHKKSSDPPSMNVDTTKLTKKERKKLRQELKRQKKAETRAARGKYANETVIESGD